MDSTDNGIVELVAITGLMLRDVPHEQQSDVLMVNWFMGARE